MRLAENLVACVGFESDQVGSAVAVDVERGPDRRTEAYDRDAYSVIKSACPGEISRCFLQHEAIGRIGRGECQCLGYEIGDRESHRAVAHAGDATRWRDARVTARIRGQRHGFAADDVAIGIKQSDDDRA